MILDVLTQNIMVCRTAPELCSTHFDLSESASAATGTSGSDPQSLAIVLHISAGSSDCGRLPTLRSFSLQGGHDESLTCDSGGGLDMGAAIRFAVMPGNGLKLPDAP